jgi:hypothetical protein
MPNFYDEKVRALIAKPRKPRVVDYPGGDFKIGVRLLSDAEIDFCREEAQKQFRKVCEKNRWNPVEGADLDPTLMQRLVEREMIARAFLDASTLENESPAPFFPSASDVATIGASIATALMRIYLEHQDVVNPSVEIIDEEVLAEIVENLKKEPSDAPSLMGIAPSTLRRLVHILARRLPS